MLSVNGKPKMLSLFFLVAAISSHTRTQPQQSVEKTFLKRFSNEQSENTLNFIAFDN